MSTISRTEQALAEIVAEFEAISTTNGYRTNPNIKTAIRDSDEVNDFPEIGIQIGKEILNVTDNAWTIMNTTVVVMVVGHIKADTTDDKERTTLVAAAEALRHDMKRKVAEMMRKYIVATGSWWFVNPEQEIAFIPIVGLGLDGNKAMVGTDFMITVRNQTNDFYAQVLAEAGDTPINIDGGAYGQ